MKTPFSFGKERRVGSLEGKIAEQKLAKGLCQGK